MTPDIQDILTFLGWNFKRDKKATLDILVVQIGGGRFEFPFSAGKAAQ